jgi:hypothetical protein
MHILVPHKRVPCIKLLRVNKTASGKTFIFDFYDPIHKFAQSLIVFGFLPAEAVLELWERLYKQWADRIKHEEWEEGKLPEYVIKRANS